MKKRIFLMLSVFIFLFAPGWCMAAEEEPHPEIPLIEVVPEVVPGGSPNNGFPVF